MFFLKILNLILSGIDSVFFCRPVVLTYHSVSDGTTPVSVSADNFEKQMGFLKSSGARVVGLDEFFGAEKRGCCGKEILITFDDGFKDVFLNALPILKKYGFPAVIFINPSLVGGKAVFATREEDKKREICSLSDLHFLEDAGVTIANHGYSHRQLSGLGEAAIFSEYEMAFSWIKENFKKNSRPDVFVFPKGAKNDRVKEFLRSRGAKVLDNRVDVYSDTSMAGFTIKLSAFYGWLRKKVFLIK